MEALYKLRFPIGEYQKPESISLEYWLHCIAVIEQHPAVLRNTLQGMSQSDLDIPYRPQGWTSRQVVHHLADSHMNMLVRLKLALTEEVPTIKPYMEERWAKLPDYALNPEVSLQLLEALHERWTILLKSLDEQQRKRTYNHPEYNKQFSIEHITGFYAWHCQHHTAHIELVKTTQLT